VGGEAAFEPPEELDGRGAPPPGQGATGQVYLAEDSVLARPVAIQLIAPIRPRGAPAFPREARPAAWHGSLLVVGLLLRG